MHKYKIDQNACFECSFESLAKDHLKCLSQQFSEYYFDNTQHMAEFSESGGFTGEGKYCIQCTQQCDYITKEGSMKFVQEKVMNSKEFKQIE
jgi:hypothetical protein